MKNKLLKTMLPLATIASVAAPVACLTSCEESKPIVGPTNKQIVGKTVLSDTTVTSEFTTDIFTVKDNTLDLDSIEAVATYQMLQFEGRFERVIVPGERQFRIHFIWKGDVESTSYPIKIQIFLPDPKVKKKTKLYEDNFTVYFQTSVAVPRSGAGTTIHGAEAKAFELTGFKFLNTDTLDNVEVDVYPVYEETWPSFTAHFSGQSNELSAYLYVAFNEAPTSWTLWSLHYFTIRIRLNSTVIFEDPTFIYSVQRGTGE